MEVLIRERRTRPDGIGEYLDTEISVASLSIGSAPDQTIQLIGPNIAAEHAEIVLSGTAIRISCRQRDLRVVVNGEVQRGATLRDGDTIEFDGHLLTLMAPPAGFDLAVELVPNASINSSDFAGAFRTELEQTWLSKRRVAWLLFAGIFALTLLIPLSELTWHHGTAQRPWLPADGQWSTGALSPAHRLAIGDDCSACHAVPFARVRDADCTSCHDRIEDHIAAPVMMEAGLAHTRCASCHREHNEPPHLVETSDSLCASCHADPQPLAQIAELMPASGFSLETHPGFQVDLLRPVARPGGSGLIFDWHDESTAIDVALESSNLRFPHDVHLDPGKVRKVDDSRPLGCTDCHSLAPDKEHFLPVTMEDSCGSCHDLKFDPTDPTRQLPHGQPMEAILAIEGHYLRKFGDPNKSGTRAAKRRLPDRSNADEQCTDGAFACAMRKTRDEAALQFTLRGCITCHMVEDSGGEDIYTRFQVYPIRLVSDYLPTAHFNHASHLTQKDATGDLACGSCHDALHSSQSSDVLIPDIDSCVQCHGDTAQPGAVVLPCIGCHIYHPEPTGVSPDV